MHVFQHDGKRIKGIASVGYKNKLSPMLALAGNHIPDVGMKFIVRRKRARVLNNISVIHAFSLKLSRSHRRSNDGISSHAKLVGTTG